MSQRATKFPSVDVVILTVIGAELQAMKRALQIDEQQRIKIDKTKYYLCTPYSVLESRPLRVVLGFVGEAGEEVAAAAAMAALKDFRPQVLLLAGIAAGLRGKIKIGDVVISDRVVNTSKEAVIEREEAPGVIEHQRAPEIERLMHSMRQSLTSYEPNLRRINELFLAIGGVYPMPSPGEEHDYADVATSIAWHEGGLGSENTLWRSATELARQTDYHRKIIAAEMEAAGVVEACRRMSIPWLVLRGISDFGDHLKNDAFHRFASEAVAAALVDFLLHGLDLDQPPTYQVSGESPFPGLQTYGYAERDRYAGRQDEITRLVKALSEDDAPALVFITGASGSGKSSLARAGLLPALEQRYTQQGGYRVKVVEEWRPGEQPLATLRRALERLGLPVQLISDEQIIDRPESLVELMRAHTPNGQRNLVVIDQFEEFFSLRNDFDEVKGTPGQAMRPLGATHQAVLSFLSALPTASELGTQFIATLREQFLEDLSRYRALHTIALMAPSIVLTAMSVDELKQSILAPLHWLSAQTGVGYAIEQSLLMRLAEEAEHDPAYLPLLQVTLSDLWDSGRLETPPDFQGIAQAIGDRAEHILTGKRAPGAPEQRGRIEQQMVIEIFLDLVDVSLYGESRREVRRRRTLSQLAGVNPARTKLIQELCDRRLLTTRRDLLNGADIEVIEVIHESLILHWPRLQQALNSEYAILQQRRNFERKLAQWIEQGRSRRHFMTGADLREAQALAARNDVALQSREAEDYLRRSVSRRNLIWNSITATLLVLLIAAVVAALWALNQANAAVAQRMAIIAQDLRIAPEVRLLLALEACMRDTNPRTLDSLQLAMKEFPWSFNVTPITASNVSWADFSADGQMLVTRSAPYKGQVWDVASGAERFAFDGELFEKISTDGKQIVFIANNTILIRDAQTGHLIARYPVDTQDIIISADISADGRWITAKTRNAELLIVRTDTSTTVAHIRLSSYLVYTLAIPRISPDGELVIADFLSSPEAAGSIGVWEIASGAQRFVLTDPLLSGISSMTFSPDGRQLLIVGQGGVQLRSTQDGSLALNLSQRYAGLTDANYTHSGAYLVTTTMGETGVRLLDTSTGDELAAIPWYTTKRSSVALAAVYQEEGQYFVTAAADETVRIWRKAAPPAIRLRQQGSDVFAVAISPDNRFIAAGMVDGTVDLWRVSDKQRLATIAVGDGAISKLRFNPHGDALVVVSAASSLINTMSVWSDVLKNPRRVFSVRSPESLSNEEFPEAPFESAEFSRDGRYILLADYNNVVQVYDVQTGQALPDLVGSTPPLFSNAISADGALIGESNSKMIRLRTARDNRVVEVMRTGVDGGLSTAIHHMGRQAAIAASDLAIYVFTPDQAYPVSRLQGHEDEIITFSYDPTGELILSTSNDATARVWNVRGQQELLIIRSEAFGFPSAAFSLDSQYAVLADRTAGSSLYVINVQQLIKLAACRVGRTLTSDEIRAFQVNTPLRLTAVGGPCPDLPWSDSAVQITGDSRMAN